jgi:hypothetical protein
MSLLKIQDQAFEIITYVNYVVYILLLLGLSYLTPESVKVLNKYMPVYISLFLLIRFNPLRNKNHHFTDLDRKIAFSSGVFLFLTTAVGAFAENYLETYVINPVKKKASTVKQQASNELNKMQKA